MLREHPFLVRSILLLWILGLIALLIQTIARKRDSSGKRFPHHHRDSMVSNFMPPYLRDCYADAKIRASTNDVHNVISVGRANFLFSLSIPNCQLQALLPLRLLHKLLCIESNFHPRWN